MLLEIDGLCESEHDLGLLEGVFLVLVHVVVVVCH